MDFIIFIVDFILFTKSCLLVSDTHTHIHIANTTKTMAIMYINHNNIFPDDMYIIKHDPIAESIHAASVFISGVVKESNNTSLAKFIFTVSDVIECFIKYNILIILNVNSTGCGLFVYKRTGHNGRINSIPSFTLNSLFISSS